MTPAARKYLALSLLIGAARSALASDDPAVILSALRDIEDALLSANRAALDMQTEQITGVRS